MAKVNMASDRETMSKMMAIYEAEDINAILDMITNDNYSSITDYQNILLSDRNKNWIEKIRSYANEKPTFFGVGAGHLAGKNGLINLLRSEGYNVTPVF